MNVSRGGWNGLVGCRGCQYQEIDRARIYIRVGERIATRSDGEFCRRLTNSALADATAFDDPLVARVERLFEIAVCDDLVWQGCAPP